MLPIKILLTSLRSLGLIGGIWLIFQPKLQINRLDELQPNVLLLLDRSASMNPAQKGINLDAELAELFSSPTFEQLSSKANIVSYGFADSLKSLSGFPSQLDSAVGPETDIGNALSEVMLQADPLTPNLILLVTDGANNSGIDPARIARLSKVPISTIGVGSVEKKLDLMITDIAINPIVYQGSKVPVEVYFRAIGAKGQSIEVFIRGPDGRTIEKRIINIDDHFSEGKASFEVQVDSSGKFFYRVEIPKLDNELTPDNNSRSISINSLANKLRILVISGAPDYGLGDFIHRLGSNSHVEIMQRTEQGGGFYEGTWPDAETLSKIDVVVFHHFPTTRTSSAKLQEFNRKLIDSSLPLCFIDGGDIDVSKLKPFSDLLPVTVSNNVGVGSGRISPIRRHAILTPPEDEDFSDKWLDLPPLTAALNLSQPKPNSELLAELVLEDGRKIPAIAISETAGRKSAAIVVRDLWKWGMFSPGEDGILEPVLERLMKWLALRKSNKQVQLEFAKDQFSMREVVSFRVNCFDEGFQPFDGSEVVAEISFSTGDPLITTLKGEGRGQYSGGFLPWSTGNYTVKVTASKDGKRLGEDRGTLTVDAYSIEFLDSYLNQPLLQSIADGSGGKYVPFESAASYFASLSFPPQLVASQRNTELWGGWLHLSLIVILLSIEWLLRIRLGML